MTNRKISQLAALTTPAAGDYLPIVDISEAAAADQNKRITIEELLRGAPDGTAAAPSIAFESDPNTGMYSAGADQLGFATAGNGRLFIDSSGKVGIGESNVQASLHVAANISDATGITWANSQVSVATLIPGNSTSNRATVYFAPYGSDNNYAPAAISTTAGTSGASTLKFFTNPSGNLTGDISAYERLRITSTGALIHIGGGGSSSTPAVQFNGSAPANSLAVDSSGRLLIGTASVLTDRKYNTNRPGFINILQRVDQSGLVIITNQTSSNDAVGGRISVQRFVGANTAVLNDDELGSIVFGGSTGDGSTTCRNAAQIAVNVDGTPGSQDMPGRLVFSTTADGASSPTPRMTIKNDGKVGIGTTSPGFKLHVVGTGNAGAIRTEDTSQSAILYLNPAFNAGVPAVQTGSNHPLAFAVNNTERLRIDSSGNVGIGTTSVAAGVKTHIFSSQSPQLLVQGDANDASIRFNKSGRTYTIGIDSSDSNKFKIARDSDLGTTTRVAIDDAGNVGIGTTSPGQKLQISGLSSQYASIVSTNSGNTGVLFGDSTKVDEGYILYANSDNSLRLGANNGNERLRIDSSGRLLVGTTSLTNGTVNVDGSFYLSDLNDNNRGLKIYEESDSAVAASGTSSDFFYNTHGGGLCQITVQRTGSYGAQATALYFAVGKGLGGSPTMTQIVGWTNGYAGITAPTINTSTGKFTITNNDSAEVRIVIHYFFNKQGA